MGLALAFSLVAAVLPSLLLLLWFYKADYFPEPLPVVLTTFGLGLLVVLPVTGIGYLYQLAHPEVVNPIAAALATALLRAAVPEECCKFLVVRVYCVRHRAFDEPMDGVVYGATASLGFAPWSASSTSPGGTGRRPSPGG